MGGYRLNWLADVARAAGLQVQEVPGWQTRGHGDFGRLASGIVCHHTADGLTGNFPSLKTVTRGRPDLSGPLCNYGLGRDGTVFVVAAGCAWHAGRGSWKGVRDGNHQFVGIEAENSGYIKGPRAEAWSDVQLRAYAQLCAAILIKIGQPVSQCIGHKEWAPRRKVDPTFDMGTFRELVASYMANPRGTVKGAVTRVAALLSVPTRHCYDGCCYGDIGVGVGA